MNHIFFLNEIDKILLDSMKIPSPPPIQSPVQILQDIINRDQDASEESSPPITFDDKGVTWTKGDDGKWRADKESNIPGSRSDAQMGERGWKPDSSAPATKPARARESDKGGRWLSLNVRQAGQPEGWCQRTSVYLITSMQHLSA